MEKLQLHHTYLLSKWNSDKFDFYGITEIWIEKITKKAIRIKFKDMNETHWFSLNNSRIELKIFEDITKYVD